MNFQIPTEPKDAFVFCTEWLNNKPYFEFQTSGSTGIPKKITLTRNQLVCSAMATGNALGLKTGDSALLCLNPSFIAGKMMLVRAMVLDLKLTIVPPSSNPLQHLPKGVSFDFMALVPLQLDAILKDKEKAKVLDKCKAIIVGGASISKELRTSIQSISAPVFSTFGMTETVSHIALQRLNGPEKTAYYTTLNGITIGQDIRECLTIKGKITNEEEIVTNDLVTLIDENKFTWRGRIDNIINSGGIKLVPEEIENKIANLLNNESISCKFVIIGVNDSKFGEKTVMAIEGKANDTSQILEILRNQLNKYELPKEIFFLENFPLTPTNKIDRLQIKKIYNE
jgi:o-succinylbenzoate---CoA ligase